MNKSIPIWVVSVVLATLLSVPLYASDVSQQWVARYTDPAGNNGYDVARALAVDTSGNVYVTGESWNGTNYDYVTVKYDSTGNRVWLVRYNGPDNGDDYGQALGLDSAGNIYVTGRSLNSASVGDYATIKYDSSGNQVWVARYNGLGNDDDDARALAVDAAGNVYVTGGSWGILYDYATVKYDTNGNQLWVARYDGNYGSDTAQALAVDAAGNVYVTGTTSGIDYATVKYDTNGNQIWVAIYSGPAYVDYGQALALDAAGNVYVTGQSQNSNGLDDYATVKYDANGNQVWVARYNGPDNGDDQARALAVDAAGNVYVTGGSENVSHSGLTTYATVKYDADGTQVWVARYNGVPAGTLDEARALAVDVGGNVYVTGRSYGDYATVKYDANGNQVWVARYNGPGNGGDQARALAVDAAGNVYVTGDSLGIDTGVDYATIKYVQNGGNQP